MATRTKRKPKTRWLPFFCQCRDCLATFDIEGLVRMRDWKIIRLESHPKVEHRQNGDYLHRCNGNGTGGGRLMLYPIYPGPDGWGAPNG